MKRCGPGPLQKRQDDHWVNVEMSELREGDVIRKLPSRTLRRVASAPVQKLRSGKLVWSITLIDSADDDGRADAPPGDDCPF